MWPLAVGVASASITEIPSEGKLGIMMNSERPRISNIVMGSGADTAGLRIHDLITAIDGRPVGLADELDAAGLLEDLDLRQYGLVDERVLQRFALATFYYATL